MRRDSLGYPSLPVVKSYPKEACDVSHEASFSREFSLFSALKITILNRGGSVESYPINYRYMKLRENLLDSFPANHIHT